jgi:hypothetical protein
MSTSITTRHRPSRTLEMVGVIIIIGLAAFQLITVIIPTIVGWLT